MAVALRPLHITWMAIAAVVRVLAGGKGPVIPAPRPTGEWWEALWPIALFLYAIAVMMGHQTVPFLYFQF